MSAGALFRTSASSVENAAHSELEEDVPTPDDDNTDWLVVSLCNDSGETSDGVELLPRQLREAADCVSWERTNCSLLEFPRRNRTLTPSATSKLWHFGQSRCDSPPAISERTQEDQGLLRTKMNLVSRYSATRRGCIYWTIKNRWVGIIKKDISFHKDWRRLLWENISSLWVGKRLMKEKKNKNFPVSNCANQPGKLVPQVGASDDDDFFLEAIWEFLTFWLRGVHLKRKGKCKFVLMCLSVRVREWEVSLKWKKKKTRKERGEEGWGLGRRWICMK